MAMPSNLCAHYWPEHIRSCDAGLRAPHDCPSCPAYADGTPYLGLSDEDNARSLGWYQLLNARLPRANFRPQNGDDVLAGD